jgi:hypothetical protein
MGQTVFSGAGAASGMAIDCLRALLAHVDAVRLNRFGAA